MGVEGFEFRPGGMAHRPPDEGAGQIYDAEGFATKHNLTRERAQRILHRSGGSRKAADEIAERERTMSKTRAAE